MANNELIHSPRRNQKDFAFGGGKYLRPLFFAKKDDNYYVCVEADYGYTKEMVIEEMLKTAFIDLNIQTKQICLKKNEKENNKNMFLKCKNCL